MDFRRAWTVARGFHGGRGAFGKGAGRGELRSPAARREPDQDRHGDRRGRLGGCLRHRSEQDHDRRALRCRDARRAESDGAPARRPADASRCALLRPARLRQHRRAGHRRPCRPPVAPGARPQRRPGDGFRRGDEPALPRARHVEDEIRQPARSRAAEAHRSFHRSGYRETDDLCDAPSGLHLHGAAEGTAGHGPGSGWIARLPGEEHQRAHRRGRDHRRENGHHPGRRPLPCRGRRPRAARMDQTGRPKGGDTPPRGRGGAQQSRPFQPLPRPAPAGLVDLRPLGRRRRSRRKPAQGNPRSAQLARMMARFWLIGPVFILHTTPRCASVSSTAAATAPDSMR